MIECQVCHKEFQQITSTHLKRHNMTVDEYRSTYPGAPILSEEVSKKLSDSCTKQHIRDANFGFQDGHKTNVGKTPWNKGDTKETNVKVLKYARKLKGKPMSVEAKVKLSNTMKKFYADHPECKLIGEKNPMYGKKLSEEHLKALWSTTYQTINKVEKEAYLTLKAYGFEYVGDRKFWLTFKDGTRKCPDFINKKAKIAVEIYGDYWHKDDDPNVVIKKYKEIGWDCFVYWEHEVKNYEFNPDRFEQDLGIWEMEDFTYNDFFNDWMY